ncbi:MAG: 1-acyl-sn-glycerol-3-phosphate acyltransferase [Spirochaetaceae bacterium]|jgi:glycerol-3-phosphate O-acyltransferase|nr:1-acyl-sn-glycerol-3-phosphate acyltransferase [Spirochaetaceae bacterium]
METLNTVYSSLIKKVFSDAKQASTRITPDNVYQLGDKNLLPYLDKMVCDLALSGSGFSGIEHLTELWKKSQEGASCLILPEHYSNLDLPGFSYFLRKEMTEGERFADDLVAIAGKKLNEDNPAVAAFASAYSRIVICPSRELSLVNGKKDEAERLRVIQINRAAMLALNRIKREHKMILVFPAGTRYRPWDPASKRGVREMDSYIKNFDYMCLVAVNGELLSVGKDSMMDDSIHKDILRYTVSPLIPCAEFRAKAKAEAEKNKVEDMKQAVVDTVMAELDKIHEAAEIERQKMLES